MYSKANARANEAEEGKAKESATITYQPGTCHESAPNRTRAKAKAKIPS